MYVESKVSDPNNVFKIFKIHNHEFKCMWNQVSDVNNDLSENMSPMLYKISLFARPIILFLSRSRFFSFIHYYLSIISLLYIYF